MNLTDIDWNDSKLQIGAEILAPIEAEITATNIRQEMCRAQQSWLFTSNFGKAFDLLIIGDAEAKSPLTFHSFRKNDCAWVLNRKKPDKWRFIASPVISWSGTNPIRWGEKEIVQEMRYWTPPEGTLDDENRRIVNGHYSGLRLWLEFYLMPNGADKDNLRELLYTSDLIYLKPYADLSRARHEFCRQLFPWSELAQRAGNEDHLWFCLEYSSCLAKLHPERNLGKVETREQTSKMIKMAKTALKSEGFVETLTIQDLHEQDEDWRLYLETLLLQDAIKLVVYNSDADTSDLEHHINQYLNALAHFNAITGHHKGDVILRRNPSGKVSQTCKGQKLKSQTKPSRGRGRPPKCNNL